MKDGFSNVFFESVLDSLVEQLAVVDSAGKIVFVNKSWKAFGVDNGINAMFDWVGVGYLDCCIGSANSGDNDALLVSIGIRSVISGEESEFTFEYPCHSSDTLRWFLMRMAPVNIGSQSYFVVTHQNITERKLAEQALAEAATKDPLTGLANRRRFNEFSLEHWKAAIRNRSTVSIAMIDIDYFKSINDRYGHAFGDSCLVDLAKVLNDAARRPEDLCARFGGEEFIIFWGDTGLSDAVRLSENILSKLRNSDIPDHFGKNHPIISVSIGVASIKPSPNTTLESLIHEADANLYEAKQNGRDRVAFNSKQRLNEICGTK